MTFDQMPNKQTWTMEREKHADMRSYNVKIGCRTQSTQDILAGIPQDVAFKACNLLSLRDRVECALVCKAWKSFALSELQSIIHVPNQGEQLEQFGIWLAARLTGCQALVTHLVLDCSLTGQCLSNPMLDRSSESISTGPSQFIYYLRAQKSAIP